MKSSAESIFCGIFLDSVISGEGKRHKNTFIMSLPLFLLDFT